MRNMFWLLQLSTELNISLDINWSFGNSMQLRHIFTVKYDYGGSFIYEQKVSICYRFSEVSEFHLHLPSNQNHIVELSVVELSCGHVDLSSAMQC